MSTFTTAIVAWFLSFAGVETTAPCATGVGYPTHTCPSGSPPPDASSGSSSDGASPVPLPGGKPGNRPAKGDGIYNGI
jgi:hypothetical protein